MHKLRVSLIAIGNELTAGKVSDTNSSFLARNLSRLGFELLGTRLVRDNIEEIVDTLKLAAGTSDLVFTTGGLGPTSDDLTREALSRASGAALEENAAAREKLENLFKARKRPLHPNNFRQVQFPRGAEIITNRIGTADAFITRLGEVPVISLPGVPKELELIFTEELEPYLLKRFSSSLREPCEVYFRCFGSSESYLGRQIEDCKLPAHLEVAYRPMFPEVLITITHLGAGDELTKKAELAEAEAKVLQAISAPYVISREANGSLPSALADLLTSKQLTLAAGESCTGGLLAHALVSLAGSSKFFLSSVVSYSNESKASFLGVRPDVLARWGAVSREIAIEMARGAKYRSGADIGVSVTGIAGPDGGREEKPVGTFFVGLATAEAEEAWEFFYPHERNMLRQYAAYIALDLVRRSVLGFPTTWERK